jgi:hypothetical protein
MFCQGVRDVEPCVKKSGFLGDVGIAISRENFCDEYLDLTG